MKLTRNKLKRLIAEMINENNHHQMHKVQRLSIALASQARDRGMSDEEPDFYRELAEDLLEFLPGGEQHGMYTPLSSVENIDHLISAIDMGVVDFDLGEYLFDGPRDDIPGYGDLEDQWSPHHVPEYVGGESENIEDLASFDMLNKNRDEMLYSDNPDYRRTYDDMDRS
tara:strand:- start:667 stop:1173 length:507 start_codon:yes stop_codon:yes gene_type:complete